MPRYHLMTFVHMIALPLYQVRNQCIERHRHMSASAELTEAGEAVSPAGGNRQTPTIRVVSCNHTFTFTSSFRPSQRRLGQEENTCVLPKLTQINKLEKRSTQLTRSTSNTSAIELASTINKSFGHQNQQHNTQKPSQTTPPIQPCPLQPSSPAKMPQPSPQPAERTT